METQPRSLVKKLAEVMASVSHVAKTGRNEFHKYDYATEADVLAAVRKELAQRCLMIIPSVDACTFEEATTNSGKKEVRCTMRMRFTVMDGESGESIELVSVGQGQDASDKASYKAATGATKYGVLKLFLIPMGDDPEEEKAPPRQSKPLPPSKPATKAIDTSKLVAAFAGLGVTADALVARIGKPLAEATEADVATLRGDFKAKKALATVTPEQEAKRIEAEKAEAGIKEEQAKARSAIDAQMKKLDEAKAMAAPVAATTLPPKFESFVARIRGAPTSGACAIIVSEAVAAKLPQGDLKALQRELDNRCLILADKSRKLPPESKEAAGEIPF